MIIPDEPSEQYHANPAIGSGDARAFLRSPQLFIDMKNGLCERESAALAFGIASHLALLEPESFAQKAVVKPDGMSFATKEGKAWRDAHEGKIIVPFEKARALGYMHARMPTEVGAIFASCVKETTVRTKIDGLAVQCRPDLWDLSGGRFFDLKTIASIDNLDAHIFKFGYHIQLAWYSRVIATEVGQKPKRAALIFVESEPPYRWRIVDLDIDFAELGERGVDEALRGIQARLKSGCWDDPEGIHHLASPPTWAADSITVAEEIA